MDQNSFRREPSTQMGDFWAKLGEEWQEVLTAYALGGLEPDEMLALDEYLQNHPELQAVVNRLDESIAGMAYVAPSALPAPGSKRALLERVNADLRMHQSNQPARRTSPSTAATAPTTPQRVVPNSPVTQPPQRRPTPSTPGTALAPYRANEPLRPAAKIPTTPLRHPKPRTPVRTIGDIFDFATGWKMATMATAAALLFFMIATAQLTGRLNQLSGQSASSAATEASLTMQLENAQAALTALRQETTTLQRENSQLQATAAELAIRLQVERQQLVSLLAVRQVVELGGTEFAPGAEGALFVGDNSLILIIHGLQPLPSGQTYQLWLIPADEEPVSAGLVQISDEATPSLTTNVSLATTTFATVGLSVEPAGGSRQPTGDIVMVGNRT